MTDIHGLGSNYNIGGMGEIQGSQNKDTSSIDQSSPLPKTAGKSTPRELIATMSHTVKEAGISLNYIAEANVETTPGTTPLELKQQAKECNTARQDAALYYLAAAFQKL